MRLTLRGDRFVNNLNDTKLLKQQISANGKDGADNRQTRSKSGIVKRKRRFSSGTDSESDIESLAVKKLRLDSLKESLSLAHTKRRSLEDKVRTNQELGRTKSYVPKNLSKKSVGLPIILIKKVSPPGSKLKSSRGSERSQTSSSRRRSIQSSSSESEAEAEAENLILSKKLKRKSRNSINALLDAQLFKPDIPTYKVAKRPEPSKDKDSSDDEDILCKSWVTKSETKPKASISFSTRSRSGIPKIKSDGSEDEDERPLKTRSRSGVLPRPTYGVSMDYESLVESSKEKKKPNWETQSTMSMSTRSRSGILKRKSYAYGDDNITKRDDKTETTSTFPTRSRSVVRSEREERWETSSNMSTRSRSGVLKRKSYLTEDDKTCAAKSESKHKKNLETSHSLSTRSRSGVLKRESSVQGNNETTARKNDVKQNCIITEADYVINNRAPIKGKDYQLKKVDLCKPDKPPPKEASLSTAKRYSSSMADVVQVKCKMCSQAVSMTSMRSHTKTAHKLNIADYKIKYGNHKDDIIEKVYHECGICHQDVLLDSDEIAMHLRGKHQITHKNYNEKFMQMKVNSISTTTHSMVGKTGNKIKQISSPSPIKPKTQQASHNEASLGPSISVTANSSLTLLNEDKSLQLTPKLEENSQQPTSKPGGKSYEAKPKQEDKSNKSVPKLDDGSYKLTYRLEDKSHKSTPKHEDKSAPKLGNESQKTTPKSYKLTPKHEGNSSMSVLKLVDRSHDSTQKLDDELQKTKQKQKNKLQKSTAQLEDGVNKSTPKLEYKTHKSSPKLEENSHKLTPKLEEKAYKKHSSDAVGASTQNTNAREEKLEPAADGPVTENEDEDIVFLQEVEGMSKEEMAELKSIEDIFDGEELFDSDEDSSDED